MLHRAQYMNSPCVAILEICSLNQSVPSAYSFLFSSTVLSNSLFYKIHLIYFFNECFNTVTETKTLWYLSKFKWPVPTPCKLYGSIKVYLFKVNSSQTSCIFANLHSHLCLHLCVYMHIMHMWVDKEMLRFSVSYCGSSGGGRCPLHCSLRSSSLYSCCCPQRGCLCSTTQNNLRLQRIKTQDYFPWSVPRACVPEPSNSKWGTGQQNTFHRCYK